LNLRRAEKLLLFQLVAVVGEMYWLPLPDEVEEAILAEEI
jgi:hypothetical protein